MDSIIHAFKAAYDDSWQEIIAGSILFDFLYFAIGGILFFFLYEKRKSGLAFKDLPRYLVDARTAYRTAPLEDARRSSRIDRWSFLLRFLWIPPFNALLICLSLVLGVYFQGLFNELFGVREPFPISNALIALFQVSVIFVVGDFGNYWNHRWMHRFPVYWSFHRIHHSAETLNYFTGDREHPMEVLPSMVIQGVSNGIGAGFALWISGSQLLPETLPALVVIGIIWRIRGVLYHSHFPLSFGKLDYLVGGPIMHQLHHSAEERHFSRNFGIQLFCWDWLFGTIYVPDKDETFRLGLSETEIGDQNPHNTLKGFYWEPIVHAWRTLFPEKDTAKAKAETPQLDAAE